jgi:hypothetical protein
VLGRYELLRPAEIQRPTWRQALGDRVDFGTITVACAP